VRGNGKRKLAVFEDPNCGYCKRFERDLQKVDNVTIHMFLYPILSPDSRKVQANLVRQGRRQDLDRTTWCATRPWPRPSATCDLAALTAMSSSASKYKITGTPTLLFADGSRVPGAISAQQVEKYLAEAK
jgi:thiol:disulfide interchange protein DsbC